MASICAFLTAITSPQEDTFTRPTILDYSIYQNLKAKTSKPVFSNILPKCQNFQNYNAVSYLAFRKPCHSDEIETLHLQNLDGRFKI